MTEARRSVSALEKKRHDEINMCGSPINRFFVHRERMKSFSEMSKSRQTNIIKVALKELVRLDEFEEILHGSV